MKKLLVLVLTIIHCYSFAQDKFRLGLHVSPTLGWTKPDNGFSTGKVRAGVEYGLITDFAFNDNGNYSLSTGVSLAVTGGNIEGPLNSNAQFKLQYVTIPILLKLKTDQFKDKFAVYGKFGLLNSFRYASKSTIEAGGITFFENENINKKDNGTGFYSTLFNFSLQAGAGVEYYISDNTSLLMGVFYNRGFIPAVKQNIPGDDDARMILNNFGLRLGVMF